MIEYALDGVNCVWDPAECTFVVKKFDAPFFELPASEVDIISTMLEFVRDGYTIEAARLVKENIIAGFINPETHQYFFIHKKGIHDYELVAYADMAQGYITFAIEPFSLSIARRGGIFFMSFSFIGCNDVWRLKCPVKRVLPLRATCGF